MGELIGFGEGPGVFRMTFPTDRWKKAAELAERLGIAPLPAGESADIVFHLDDGRRYDGLAIIAAVLDRLDEATS